MILKPQDVVILLKLVTIGKEDWSFSTLSAALFMSPSEVHAGVHRTIAAKLATKIVDRITPAIGSVDVIVEVATLAQYHLFSDQLRQSGFVEDTSEAAPICRWKAGEVILDVMPTDPKILGFGNQWFPPAYGASERAVLPSGKQIRLLPAPYFLATKLEAFDCRGKNDYNDSNF